MWSNPMILCDEKSLNGRPTHNAAQRRDAVIQLVSMISIVVQSAGTAYQRDPEDGDRVVKTVCELSRQALAELRVWPTEPVSPVPFVPCDRTRAVGYTATLAQAQPHAASHAMPPSFTALFLTPRDLDVMRLIVRGLSNKEIAATLHLTEGTVKGYVSHLLSKLNVRSRTRAATVAIEQGWV